MSSQTTYTAWDSENHISLRSLQAVWVDDTEEIRPLSYDEFLKGTFFTVKKPVGRNPL